MTDWREDAVYFAGHLDGQLDARKQLLEQVEALLAKLPRRRMASLTYETGFTDGRRSILADVLDLLGGERDG